MTHTKKGLVSANSQAPIAIQSNIHCTRSRPFVSTEIIERTVTTETKVVRRMTYTLAPICSYCGEAKGRIIGVLWICPNCDPDPAAAIPLPGEGEEIIDVEPVEKRRAA